MNLLTDGSYRGGHVGNCRVVLLIGYTEMIIGVSTLITILGGWLLNLHPKPPNVLFFITVTASLSILLGLGIIKINKFAYQLLFYFSSVIILSKILIFLEIIQLNGALVTVVPEPLKNSLSIIYHLVVLYFLQQDDVKKDRKSVV